MPAKTLLLLLFSMLSLQTLWAQHRRDSTRMNIDSLKPITLRANGYFYNNKPMNGVQLGSLLTKFKTSNIEYRKFSNRKVEGAILLIGSVTSGILGIANAKQYGHFWTPYTISMASLAGIGLPIFLSAHKHLKRSVSHYNTQVVH